MKENIAILLSVIATLVTVLNFAISIYRSRVKLSLRVIDYSKFEFGNGFSVYMSFTNLSHLPVAITNIRVKAGSQYIDCSHIPEIAMELKKRSGEKVEYTERIWTKTLPINLQPLGGSSGFLVFSMPEYISPPGPKDLIFQVSPNRGKAFEISLEPDHIQFVK